MKELKEDYERRLKTVLAESKDCPLDIEKESRLETKASCYRTFIAELNRALTIYSVVVPKGTFYCVNKEVGYKDNICLDQCITCGMREKPQ